MIHIFAVIITGNLTSEHDSFDAVDLSKIRKIGIVIGLVVIVISTGVYGIVVLYIIIMMNKVIIIRCDGCRGVIVGLRYPSTVFVFIIILRNLDFVHITFASERLTGIRAFKMWRIRAAVVRTGRNRFSPL